MRCGAEQRTNIYDGNGVIHEPGVRCSWLEYTAAPPRGGSRKPDKGKYMGPYVDSIVSDEALPASTGVVIICGGIIGTSAALHLASRGGAVVLCEKGYIAC